MTEAPITDPKTLRALSHPFRWKLLQLLTEEGPRTATQCSEVLGESVASCSYHLNMLAKYGFVTEVEGPGRQKPWKIVPKRQSISSEGLEGETAMAAEAAAMAYLDQEFERTRTRLRQREHLPQEWREAVGTEGTVKFITAQEAVEYLAELRALLDKYDERRLDPALRPEGSRPVRLFLSHTVAPD
ncbi:winged helix-turn-helix domain-containing protein [Lentzea albidocapillata]|uniref:Helix-turn-helix domain-containing protein n=1 Tax=Lentzea albidocapillata TaxID=40571 RepID=A0A1W2FRC4_9PSEU|nr:helix-turn-helix domain-containing protein [Lentzea albidocapillata]SMD24158.1 Helix-turn-helix domain-containing protein [Lentzea albidocapillata]